MILVGLGLIFWKYSVRPKHDTLSPPYKLTWDANKAAPDAGRKSIQPFIGQSAPRYLYPESPKMFTRYLELPNERETLLQIGLAAQVLRSAPVSRAPCRPANKVSASEH